MNNLFLIISEDKSIRDFNLYKILEKLDYQEDGKIIIDLNTSSFSDLLDEAGMMSMFCPTKVIIANNFNIDKITENDFNYLEKYLNNPNKDSYIILLANKIDSRKKSYKLLKDYFKIIDGTSFNNGDVLEYFKNILIEKKYQMRDIEYFINKVGNDINNINLELSKLMIYKEKDKIITINDINLLVKDNIENVMYEFTNAYFDKDYDKLMTMYERFKRDNISQDYLISSLAGSIRTNIIIKLLKNQGKSNQEIAKVIGKKEFFVKKTLERLYYYTLNGLTETLIRLADIDYQFKSGKSNIDELEFFLLNK